MYGEFCAKLADQIERGAQLVKQWCKRLKMRSKMDPYARRPKQQTTTANPAYAGLRKSFIRWGLLMGLGRVELPTSRLSGGPRRKRIPMPFL